MERLQGPVIDVPVPSASPGASTATPVPALPARPGAGTSPGGGTPGVPGTGTPGGGSTAPGGALPGAPSRPAPSTALPPAPIVVPAIPPHPGPFRIQRRSLADMANEQLRRDRKPPLTQGMEDAAVDDCLHEPSKPPMMGGLLAAPGLAAKALSGRCPK
jgi:hypothetical protein